jgi:hypothetical protein
MSRDYPLAESPKPNYADNTMVRKDAPLIERVKYNYKESSYSSKDSADYRKGMKAGMNDKVRTKEGARSVVGLNDAYNSGYSEGKDIAISKRKK